MQAQLTHQHINLAISGSGSGALAAFANALKQYFKVEFDIVNYSEHALTTGTDADAIAYVQIKAGKQCLSGVAINSDILTASLAALLSAANQLETIS